MPATAPARAGLVSRMPPTATVCAVGVLGALLAAARLPSWAWSRLTFEDGWLFLGEWGTLGPRAIAKPYSGYLHVLPRLLGGAVHHLPVASWAAGVTAAACLVTGAVCAVAWVVDGRLVRTTPARLALALAPALCPALGDQVLGNLNTLHTLLLVALALVVVAPPGPRRPRPQETLLGLGTAGLTALVVLSEIQAAVLAPLVLAALLVHRGRRLPLALGWALGTIAQLAVMATHPRPTGEVAGGQDATTSILGTLVNTLVTPVTSSQRAITAIVSAVGLPGLLLLLVLVTGVLVAAARAVRPRRRTRSHEAGAGPADALSAWAPLLWLGLGLTLFVLARVSNGGTPALGSGVPRPWRWGVAGSVLVACALVIACERLCSRRGRAVAAVLALIAVVAGFAAPLPYRATSLDWPEQVRLAAQECGPDEGVVSVPQSPTLAVPVPCDRLP